MSTILKNILQFTGLVVGAPVSLPHGLNVNGIPVAPQLGGLDSGGFLVTADDSSVTVTRTTGTATVNVYVEHWHTIEDVTPIGGLIGLTPFFFANGGAGGGAGGTGNVIDLSVNNARADLGTGKVVLRTGGVLGSPNVTGAFNGGGTGNKSILGIRGFHGLPLSALHTLEYSWTSQLGPTSSYYNPPGAEGPSVPFMNMLVDFNPLTPGGDIRVLAILNGPLGNPVAAAIGSRANPGGLNTLVYNWNETQAVQVVNSPPNPTPGGVAPLVTLGPSWPSNAYSWAQLKAANPNAIFVDTFPANPLYFPNGDGGAPAGAIMPALWLVSGDSGTLEKSGKRILDLKINGASVLT